MKSNAVQNRQRGRPPSQKKHQRILEAATRLFTEHGYEGTSVDDIAAAASVSKQTVYSHFGSKENLFGLAVAEKCKASGVDEDAIDMDLPPEVLIPQVARRFVTLVKSREALRVYAICTNSCESHPRIAELFYLHGPQKTVDVLSVYLQRQVALGRLTINDPDAAAWQFLCMLKGEAHMRAQFGLEALPQEAEDAYIDGCVEMFLRAYGAAPRSSGTGPGDEPGL
jgi:TetR/AcrR family transcriptional repressor of mexJK operon